MQRVTGIGGVFFRSKSPDELARWYADHLGLPLQDSSFAVFPWREVSDPEKQGSTVWALFERDTSYFGETGQQFMINYRVENLDELVAALQAEGVDILPDRMDDENGRFAWIVDPDGNRIELWEPPRA
jgi:predicted enzyme related to lactoylglutathione lyase